MPTTTIEHDALSAEDHKKQLYRAVIASTIGTTIEWYDFFLYSIVTGLAFAKLYFPNSDPLTGTLQAFGIYAVGFAARPVGAAIFGHYGDRIGRKAALIATLLLMGLATFAVAFVPTYERIGIWGAIILTLLRFIQGVGVGGEWGGSVLLSMEWARTTKNRGLIASWPQFGVPAGLFLANLAVLAFSAISGDQFLVWGWRAPFMISILLVGIGLYIRLSILETPIFARLVAERKVSRAPTVEVLGRHPKQIILTALVRMGEQAPFYIFTAFVFTYGTTVLGSTRDLILIAVLTASVLSFFVIPFSGYLSDRIGRRRMYMLGAATMGVFRLHLLCAPQYHGPRLDLSCYPAVAHTARHDVRSAGRADRGELYRPASVQRRISRLSACVRDRGRPRASHRDSSVCPLPLGLCDCLVHPGLRDHQPGFGRHAQGLHKQRHLGRIRRAVATRRADPGCCGIILQERLMGRRNKYRGGGLMAIGQTLNVNGKPVSITVDDPDMPLLYALAGKSWTAWPPFRLRPRTMRRLYRARRRQSRPLVLDAPLSVEEENKIITLEGLGTLENLHPVQKAFIEEQAAQCGYCINGMIMESAAFLAVNAKPSEADVKRALAKNLCRCGTHARIVRAVLRASGRNVIHG